MAKGVNKVFLLGNCGKEPEIRTAPDGGMVIANFTLATADRQKDAQGNWQDKTEWHNLVAFQRTAEIVRDYVKKGTQLSHRGQDPDALVGRQGVRPEALQDRDSDQRTLTARHPGRRQQVLCNTDDSRRSRLR